MSKPEIVIGENGVTLYQAMAVRSGLKALLLGFKVNRAYTSTNCRAMASRFTGKKYPAGQAGIKAAIADLTVVIDGAAPVVREAGNIRHA